MSAYTFAVITKVPDADKGEKGNLCITDLYVRKDDGTIVPAEDIIPTIWAGLVTPVFTVGEILVLDSAYGREVSGLGRKPSKWEVGVETFTEIEKAIDRAKEVTNQD